MKARGDVQSNAFGSSSSSSGTVDSSESNSSGVANEDEADKSATSAYVADDASEGGEASMGDGK